MQAQGGVGRDHAGGRSNEQRVVEQDTQPAQRMADRRLREAEALARGGQTAQIGDGQKHAQQIQIRNAGVRLCHDVRIAAMRGVYVGFRLP